MAIAGLKLLVPSSVSAAGGGSSAGVSATGKVTFSTATGFSVNDVFSSTYDNYLIVMTHQHSDSSRGINIRMRASGTDDTGSNYIYYRTSVNGSSFSGLRSSALTQCEFDGTTEDGPSGSLLYVYGPALASPTAFRSLSADADQGGLIYDHTGTHNQSTAYDGFTITNNLNTFSGACTVYGLSQ